MRFPGDDEYQHPTSMGSLASAQRCWLSLLAAGVDAVPQHFSFTYDCPTLPVASALATSLCDRCFGGIAIGGTSDATIPDTWRVRGLTRRRVPSLEYLEHLFTALRRVAGRHEARLTGLTVSAAGTA